MMIHDQLMTDSATEGNNKCTIYTREIYENLFFLILNSFSRIFLSWVNVLRVPMLLVYLDSKLHHTC